MENDINNNQTINVLMVVPIIEKFIPAKLTKKIITDEIKIIVKCGKESDLLIKESIYDRLTKQTITPIMVMIKFIFKSPL